MILLQDFHVLSHYSMTDKFTHHTLCLQYVITNDSYYYSNLFSLFILCSYFVLTCVFFSKMQIFHEVKWPGQKHNLCLLWLYQYWNFPRGEVLGFPSFLPFRLCTLTQVALMFFFSFKRCAVWSYKLATESYRKIMLRNPDKLIDHASINYMLDVMMMFQGLVGTMLI